MEELPERYKTVFECSVCHQFFGWQKYGSLELVTKVEKKKKPIPHKHRLSLVAAASLLFALLAPIGTHAQACDASLWQHVYNPQRLVVKQDCVSVTGTIVDATATRKHPSKDGVRHEGDGDTHGWLRVDPEFVSLLNDGNRSNEGGNLVFEVICQFRVTQKDAKAVCKKFQSAVKIPPPGTRVRITGTYVEDQEHAKWREIHPVTSIEVLQESASNATFHATHWIECGSDSAQFTPLGYALYRAYVTRVFLIGCHAVTL